MKAARLADDRVLTVVVIVAALVMFYALLTCVIDVFSSVSLGLGGV